MRANAVWIALALCACATPQQRAERDTARAQAAASTCRAAGFQDGTLELAQCAAGILQQQAAARQQENAALMGLSGALLLQSVQPAPAPRKSTTCSWQGPFWICN